MAQVPGPGTPETAVKRTTEQHVGAWRLTARRECEVVEIEKVCARKIFLGRRFACEGSPTEPYSRDGPLGDYPIGAAQLLVHVASYVARSRR